MSLNSPQVSVIIPTYYRYSHLAKVLEAIQKQRVKPLEIVIVDQTPLKQRPVSFYHKFKELPIFLINMDLPSLSESRNLGAAEASGKYLLFIDDDMEFDSDFIQNHLEVMDNEKVDVVYGAISTGPKLPEVYERDTTRLDPISFFLKSPNRKWEGMVLVVSGANTLIRRDIFLQVGGFDKKMPRMEDIELGYRLYLAGAKLYYSTKPLAIHKAASTGGTRATQKNIQYIRLLSKIYLYRKHFSGWTTQQFYLFVLKNAILYRDPVSGVFYLSHLQHPLWPLKVIFLLLKAHREASALLQLKTY